MDSTSESGWKLWQQVFSYDKGVGGYLYKWFNAMNMKIEYENAKLSEYEEIHTVMQTSAREISRKSYQKKLVDTFDKFYIDKTKDYIKQTLENPDNHTIVAKDNNRIIGFIQLKVNQQNGIISHLYILPGYEGNSIGTQLFTIIKEQAVQLIITKLMIESTLEWDKNTR